MSSRRAEGSYDGPEHVLYTEQPPDHHNTIHLSPGEAKHARQSLRVTTGQTVWVADGKGRRYRGTATVMGKDSVEVSVAAIEEPELWPLVRIWLATGVLKSTRTDFVVEKASELGVARWSPLLLKRCVARPERQGAKADRWRRLAVESLKQCRRAHLMEVTDPLGLQDLLSLVSSGSTLWLADPGGCPAGEAPLPPPGEDLILIAGPEGGMAEDEREMLVQAGAACVGLGPHRLRAETAALTLVVGALGASGNFGHGNPSTTALR